MRYKSLTRDENDLLTEEQKRELADFDHEIWNSNERFNRLGPVVEAAADMADGTCCYDLYGHRRRVNDLDPDEMPIPFGEDEPDEPEIQEDSNIQRLNIRDSA